MPGCIFDFKIRNPKSQIRNCLPCFRRYPESQVFAEHQATLRVQARDRAERDNTEGQDQPLPEHGQAFSKTVFFRQARQKQGRQDGRNDQAEHRYRHQGPRNDRQIRRQNRGVKAVAAQKHGQPADHGDNERVSGPGMKAVDLDEDPAEELPFRDLAPKLDRVKNQIGHVFHAPTPAPLLFIKVFGGF